MVLLPPPLPRGLKERVDQVKDNEWSTVLPSCLVFNLCVLAEVTSRNKDSGVEARLTLNLFHNRVPSRNCKADAVLVGMHVCTNCV